MEIFQYLLGNPLEHRGSDLSPLMQTNGRIQNHGNRNCRVVDRCKPGERCDILRPRVGVGRRIHLLPRCSSGLPSRYWNISILRTTSTFQPAASYCWQKVKSGIRICKRDLRTGWETVSKWQMPVPCYPRRLWLRSRRKPDHPRQG